MTPTRTWIAPRAQQIAAYATGVLSSPVSLLPGLSGVESMAAMAYMRSLPSSRNRSIVEAWAALPAVEQHAWVRRTRAKLEDA